MFDDPVILEPDPDPGPDPDPETGTVLVGFPDVPFCHSTGDDADEALLNAVDALETALAVVVNARQL